MTFLSTVTSIVDTKMAVPIWYSIAIGLLSVLRLFLFGSIWIFRFVLDRMVFSLLKYLLYPYIFRRILFVKSLTRYHAILWLVFTSVNVVCMKLGITSSLWWTGVSSRAATMSIINIVPLLCGPRLLFVTKLLGISLNTQHDIHRWIGQMAIFQALVHSTVSIVRLKSIRWSSVKTELNLSGLIGAISLLLLFIFSFSIFGRLAYELFLKAHLIFTFVALAAIWIHLSSKRPVGQLVIRIAVALWTLSILIHGLFVAFRNFTRRRFFATAQVICFENAIGLELDIPRTWNVRAGQFIYLTLPGIGIASALQSHPFMISWWQRHSDGLTISLLIEPRQGFTGKLKRNAGRELIAFVDGLYGIDYDLGSFGTVLMFASGIGIAGQLPFLKEIVTGYNECTVRTRRILLIWQFHHESHQDWVKKRMDEIIELDTGHILEMNLYVVKEMATTVSALPKLPAGIQYPEVIQHGTHSKLNQIFDRPNLIKILKAEFLARKGRLVVSVCANKAVSAEIREVVIRYMDKETRLVELEFRPAWIRSTVSRAPSGMDFGCRGV